MANKANSLARTKWMCKYHIVFNPKYRRKIIYNQYRDSLKDIIIVVQIQRGRDYRGAYDARSCSSFGEYPSEDQRIKLHGIPQGEKCINDVR